MAKQQTLPIKVGDFVEVISGFHKSQTGEVTKVNRKTGKILVKGINFKFKHLKPKDATKTGEIKQVEAFFHHSNVKLTVNKTL